MYGREESGLKLTELREGFIDMDSSIGFLFQHPAMSASRSMFDFFFVVVVVLIIKMLSKTRVC